MGNKKKRINIKGKGVVCGCVWNEKMEAEIVAAESMRKVDRMRGLKYVQSDLKCFSKIEEALKVGKKVLFSSVPCQVAAAQRKFGSSDRFYTISYIYGMFYRFDLIEVPVKQDELKSNPTS